MTTYYLAEKARQLISSIIHGAQVAGLIEQENWLAEQEMKDRWSQLLEEKISRAWPE